MQTPKPIGPGRQFITCAIMCGLAALVILLFQDAPYLPGLLSGLPLHQQAILGLALGGLYSLFAVAGHRFITSRQATSNVIESYSRLDLRGWNPVWIALAAGIGEELLFRGALQPLIGIWGASILFVLAHTRAYRFDSFNQRVLIQALGMLVVSVGFGYVAHYAGLLAAMVIHAAMDVAGLYAIRRATHVPATAAS